MCMFRVDESIPCRYSPGILFPTGRRRTCCVHLLRNRKEPRARIDRPTRDNVLSARRDDARCPADSHDSVAGVQSENYERHGHRHGEFEFRNTNST